MAKSIPLSVRNLLEERDYEPGRSARYIHRPEDRGPRNGLTWPAAQNLVADGAIRNDWVGEGAAIAVQ
jgi:hypothetical protein